MIDGHAEEEATAVDEVGIVRMIGAKTVRINVLGTLIVVQREGR